tara:strand:+ start:636 stop:908 length:273 start_codon:yes stop_codon:yes gene_type:complete
MPTKLWILNRFDGTGYDQTRRLIIRATSEEEAREIAQSNGLDECVTYSKVDGRFMHRIPIPFWTDPTKTSCEVLTAEGPIGVVLMQTLDG